MEILLRPVAEADLPIFHAQQDDPVANELADFPARDLSAFLEHWGRILRDPSGIVRTIEVAGEVVGNIVGFNSGGHREIGYWLGRDFWGAGIGSAAVAEFLLIETTRPLFGAVSVRNLPSLRVLTKNGFSVVGADEEMIELRLD